MSGDMQARKRKEKKRKKDEEDNIATLPTVGNVSESVAENTTIHVYKESNTGGHWCARIIFFMILAILVGFIGVIIVEHRGTTDINTPLESSRWAYIFDGWVDDSLSLSNEDIHDDKHEEPLEVEETEEKDDDDTKGDDAEDEISNEDTVSDDETLTEYGDQENEVTQDQSDEEQDPLFQSEEELSHEKEQDNEEEEYIFEDETNNLEESDDNDDNDNDDNDDNDNDDNDDNDNEVLEEIYGTSKDKNSDEESFISDTDNQFEDIVEVPIKDDIFEKFSDIPGVNEINNDNIEPLEEVENVEPEEYINEIDVKLETEEMEEESASVATKFGVGVALVVAAHFVLVKRWNTASMDRKKFPTTNRANVEQTKIMNNTQTYNFNTSDAEDKFNEEEIQYNKYKELNK